MIERICEHCKGAPALDAPKLVQGIRVWLCATCMGGEETLTDRDLEAMFNQTREKGELK